MQLLWMPGHVFLCAFVFDARRTLCDPTWRNTSVQICPIPDISFFDFDRSLNPSPHVNACRLNICLCNGYNAMHASSIKIFTVQDSVPANVKPTSCTLSNSAGEEEAPCTNASHACAGSLLKRALNNLKKSRTWHTLGAGGSPWALVPPHQKLRTP